MGHHGTIIRSVRFGVQWAFAGRGDLTGRDPPHNHPRGDEQRTNFRRRGLVGDPPNDFTRSAAVALDGSRGDLLIRAGDEADRSRVESCSHADSNTAAQRAAENRS